MKIDGGEMSSVPAWQDFEGKTPEELLAPYPFWPDLSVDECDRRYQICEDIRDADDDDDEYLVLAYLAAARLDIQNDVYEPYLWGDVLAQYWYGPSFSGVPELDFDSSGDDYSWVGQLADFDTPPWALARAASTSDLNQRLIVAHNIHTPPAVLAALADWQVGSYEGEVTAFYVGMNPSTPHHALAVVAGRNAQSQEESDDLGNDLFNVVLLNPNCPSDLLVLGSQHEDASLRASVAHNLAAPIKLLAALAEDQDSRVAQTARGNPMFME